MKNPLNKDKIETRGRPRKAAYKDACDEIRLQVGWADLAEKPTGHAVVVELRNTQSNRLRCSFEYREMVAELKEKGIAVSLFTHPDRVVVKAQKR